MFSKNPFFEILLMVISTNLAAALHGDKDYNERTQIMFAFKNGNVPILVATDVAGF